MEKEQQYGAPVLDRILNLYHPDSTHVGFMVTRPGKLPPVGPFTLIGDAIRQAEQDRFAERKHNREPAIV